MQQVESGAESRDELRGLESEAFPQEHVRSLYAGARWVLVAALRQPGLKTEVRCGDSVTGVCVCDWWAVCVCDVTVGGEGRSQAN